MSLELLSLNLVFRMDDSYSFLFRAAIIPYFLVTEGLSTSPVVSASGLIV